MGMRNQIMSRITGKAQQLATDHKEELEAAIRKGEEAADRQTQGKYHDKLHKAAQTAESYVEKLPDSESQAPAQPDQAPPTP